MSRIVICIALLALAACTTRPTRDYDFGPLTRGVAEQMRR